MRENVVYGLGGYLPDHPNGNVIERMVDNGDGTGTLIVYDEAGQITEERALTSLPVVAPDPVDPIEALRSAITAKMTDPAVNSIAKVKAAVVAAFDDALGQ